MHPTKRLGFLAGTIEVPDDFDRMAASEVERLFVGDVCCIDVSLRDSPPDETKLNVPSNSGPSEYC